MNARRIAFLFAVAIAPSLLFAQPIQKPFPRPVRPASEVVRYPVVDGDGEQVGRVEDLLLDLGNGGMPYVVFSLSGLNGFGNELRPIPLAYLQVHPEADSFLLGVDQREIIREAPTLADAASEAGASVLRDYWASYVPRLLLGLPPMEPVEEPVYRLGGARVLPGSLALLSDLAARPVTDPDGRKVAELADFAVNVSSGRILYVMLDPAPGIGTGDRRVLAPLSALSLNTRDGSAFVNVEPDQLAAAPSYTPDRQVDFSSPNLLDRVRSFWYDADLAAALRPGARLLPAALLRGTTLTGFDVQNASGESVGRLADLVITRGGRVPYAAVESAGQWHYIPLGAFLLDRSASLAVVEIEPGLLERMPGFPPGELPDTSGQGWDLGIRAFWEREVTPAARQLMARIQQEPSGESGTAAAEGPQAFLASQLMSFGVQDPGGDELGTVADLVIDVESARLAAPVLSAGGSLGVGEKLLPLPPSRLTIDAARKVIVLDADRRLLEEAPGFAPRQWPDTLSRGWIEPFENWWPGQR